MSIWNPGNQIIGVETVTKTGTFTELGIAQTQTTTVWKTGCVFEVQISAMPGRAEDVTATTTTTKETAWAIFPPDADTMAITNAGVLRYVMVMPSGVAVADLPDGVVNTQMPVGVIVRDYDMRGDAVTEADMDGLASHVFCLCEYQS